MPFPKSNQSTITWKDVFKTETMVAYYQDHPCEFIEDFILSYVDGKIEPEQRELIESIAKYKRVTARSGRGVGKSASVSWIILWWLCCFPESKVICTAPSRPQMETALWPEVDMWLKKSPILSQLLTWTATKLYMNERPSYWFAQPRTASKDSQTSMSGLHNTHLLLICDEAGGTEDSIIEEFIGTMSGEHNHMVLIGNPVRTSGIFYESHTKDKRWTRLHFNAELSARCDKETHQYIADKYGKNSDKYRIDVLGEFPKGNPDAFIPLEKIKAAMMRDVEPSGDIFIGVDVARFGSDNTVLAWRWGNKVFPLQVYENTSVDTVVTRVIKLVEDIRSGEIDSRSKSYKKTIKVTVDVTGIGSGVADMLRLDRTHNIEVVDVNFGATGTDEYERYATVMWANLRDHIDHVSLPTDKNNFLEDELSNRRYVITLRGKTMIEPKDDYKKRMKASPDRADAVVLCFANKQSERMVLKDFDHLDNKTVGVVSKMGYLDYSEKYVSLFYHDPSFASVIYCTWTGSRLVITDEYDDDGHIPLVAHNIQLHDKANRILGNEKMFNKKTDDMSTQFRRYNIPIMDNYRYDEYGAIQALQKLVSQKKIFISDKCEKTINQFRTWRLDGNKNDLYKEFGLCYAICNVVSELKNHHKLEPVATNFFPAYTNEKEKFLKTFNKTGNLSNKALWQSL